MSRIHITLLAAMALVLFLFVPGVVKKFNMQRKDKLTFRVMLIGRSLTATTNSSDLGTLSPPLEEALTRFLGSKVVVEDCVQPGDDPPPRGDGTATHRLYLANTKGEGLAIRLRNESISSPVRVLGFAYLDPNAVRAIPRLEQALKDTLKFESSFGEALSPNAPPQ